MSKLWVAAAVLLWVVPMAWGDDSPAVKKENEAQAKFDAAMSKASEAFHKSEIIANKQLIADLKIAQKIATGTDADLIANQLKAAIKNLEEDQKAVHSLIRLHDDTPGTKTMVETQAESISPDIGSSESDCDALESKKGWRKVITEKSESDGNHVEYRSGFHDQRWATAEPD